MKKSLPFIVLILCMMVVSLSAQVQKTRKNSDNRGPDRSISLIRTDIGYSNALEMKKTYQFGYNDKTYSLNYRGSNITEVMKDNPEAMSEMKKFRTKRTISIIGVIGAPVCFALALYEMFNKSESMGYALFGSSVALYVINLGFYNNSAKNLINAVNYYNKSLDNKGNTSFQMKLSPVFGINKGKTGIFPGVGLSLTF
ncbi:MAG: hypothetical protein NTU44_14845 [Bacteroidetes bacterium]|nr:hypothetical protein [Bacteroidota bacterium]